MLQFFLIFIYNKSIMYSSRRKSKRSYRKRVVSRKNKTRAKRKNLKFRKMRGGGRPGRRYDVYTR